MLERTPESALMELNRKFDHAALKPEVDEGAIRKLCREADQWHLYSVAVNPAWVITAAQELKKSSVKILSVSGFPLGASRTDIKIDEAIKGVSDGAHEIDMVANIGWLVSDQFALAESEIRQIRDSLPSETILKVIIEAGKLTQLQQTNATTAVINGGAQYVKTCTGFFGGATIEQVKLLFEAAGGQVKVKASGGIRSLDQCRQLIKAGASRLGSSCSVEIMRQVSDKAEI